MPIGALHAIYQYWGDPIDLKTVIAETEKLPGGGTLGVHLSVHALRRGYEVDTWVALLSQVLGEGTPLITGVDGTYLYQCIRETEQGPDDVKGDGFGHFLVLCGYRTSDESMAIADPLKDNPLHGTKYYRANVYRVIGSIFLGVGSDDGNLLRIRPEDWRARLGKRAS